MKDPENYVVNLLDLNRLLIEQFDGFRNFQAYKSMCEKVRNISVLKEPNKHGKWIVKTRKLGGCFDLYQDYIVCSICSDEHYYGYGDKPNYCEKCGAKMDLEK